MSAQRKVVTEKRWAELNTDCVDFGFYLYSRNTTKREAEQMKDRDNRIVRVTLSYPLPPRSGK